VRAILGQLAASFLTCSIRTDLRLREAERRQVLPRYARQVGRLLFFGPEKHDGLATNGLVR